MTQFGTAVASDAPPFTGGVVPRRGLFARLQGAARVTEVSAPAGYGKTVLLRSWIDEAGLSDRAAWVSVHAGERDSQRFLVSLLDGLRMTAAVAEPMRGVSAAPDAGAEVLVERLLDDLSSLADRLWFVVDDLHELRSEEALRQLERLLIRAPDQIRFVLLTRHDLRLGLHRFRLEGGMSEIRARDLRFSLDEARALFDAAGVTLSESSVARLHERTEGWAAGLRLAALSLARHPDPERFTAEFSGSERTVAEYLLSEVLERQPEEVRRLLLRTCVLERVSGPLADLLTGGQGGERILQELEDAGAFVVALDAGRSWFRYHGLFADRLALELRRTSPGEVPALHRAAAGWFAEHGHPAEAVRHAQVAEDWGFAARLLLDHWLGLYLDGRSAVAQELITAFPAGTVAENAELTALTAANDLRDGALEDAERHLALAVRQSQLVPADRRARFEVSLTILRLQLARQRGDVSGVAGEARQILTLADAPEMIELELGEDLRAFALTMLGIGELWALGREEGSVRLEEAERHLDRGIALAHRIRRPYLELIGVAHTTLATVIDSWTLAARRSIKAIELAERHGWGDEPPVGIAYMILGATLVGQARLEEAERWLGRAERVLGLDGEPMPLSALRHFRGVHALAGGRYQRAVDALREAERLSGPLTTPRRLSLTIVHCHTMQALVKMREIERAEAMLAQMDEHERASGYMAAALAELRLAQHDPAAAHAVLASALDAGLTGHPVFTVEALLLKAIVRDALGDTAGSADALERALDLAEPDSRLVPFLLHPAPRLLARHRRQRSAHAALIAQILNLLAGSADGADREYTQPLSEPLSEAETRVLRYLPTNLSQREIASELYISVNTIKTHIEHLYAKLDVHSRTDAVERARSLALLAPSRQTH